MTVRKIKIIAAVFLSIPLLLLVFQAQSESSVGREVALPKAFYFQEIDYFTRYKCLQIYQKQKGDYIVNGQEIAFGKLLGFIESTHLNSPGKRTLIFADKRVGVVQLSETIQVLAKTGFDYRIILAATTASDSLVGYTLKLATLHLEASNKNDEVYAVDHLTREEISAWDRRVIESKKKPGSASLIIGIGAAFDDNSLSEEARESLEKEMRSASQKYPHLSLYLLPVKENNYQNLIKALDLCEKIGVQDIQILTGFLN